MRFSVIIGAMLALASCQKAQQAPANEAAPAAEAGPQKGVDRGHKGEAMPDISISAPDGRSIRLAELSGSAMLLNLWATWCAPCVKELPTLQTASDQHGGSLTVLPVSQDDGPQPSVAAFLTSHKLRFAAYQDPKMALSAALGPDTVLPTSIFYDAEGKEVWRYVGDLDWTGPEAAKLLSEAGAARTKG